MMLTSWSQDREFFAYSAARAIRFPIIEELYRNESSGVRQFAGNALLEPEDGLHHNLSIEKLTSNGSMSINFYQETIDDVIFNFTEITNNTNIATALPVDEVDTDGVEFIYNNTEFLNPNLSLLSSQKKQIFLIGFFELLKER